MTSNPPASLVSLTHDLPGIGGQLRGSLEDFQVEELPAYEPCGEGEHTWLRFEKRDMTTPFALEKICRALGCDPREAGYAGLKDRHAVTVQCVTLARVDPAKVEALSLDGIRVISVSKHRNKIRTGHLHGNRFFIRVTGLLLSEPEVTLRCEAIAAKLRTHGCPNYFGDQRFGRDRDNGAQGIAWLKGERPAPREPFLRKLWASAAQSELFNNYLSERVHRGLIDRYLDGDLAQRHPVGGAFAIDPLEAQELYASGGASATGPIFGASMRTPSGEARALEETVLTQYGLSLEAFATARKLAEGTRRAVRALVPDLGVRVTDRSAEFTFTLPAGSYATVLLNEFIKSTDVGLKPRDAGGIQPTDPVVDDIKG